MITVLFIELKTDVSSRKVYMLFLVTTSPLHCHAFVACRIYWQHNYTSHKIMGGDLQYYFVWHDETQFDSLASIKH